MTQRIHFLARIGVAVCALLLLQTPVYARDDKPVILVFGDSLSAGFGVSLQDAWTTLLQNKLNELDYGYKVVNASISGDTTSGGLRRLPRALKVHQPEIVILELGGNDGLRATPVPVIRDNLTQMILQSQDIGAKVVLAGMQMPPNYGEAYTEEFARIYFEVADEYGVGLIPFFLKNVALNPMMMQPDGIHPTAEAQPLLLDNTWDALEPLLEKPASDETPVAATNPSTN